MMVKWFLWHRAAQCVQGVGTGGDSGRLYRGVLREVVTTRE